MNTVFKDGQKVTMKNTLLISGHDVLSLIKGNEYTMKTIKRNPADLFADYTGWMVVVGIMNDKGENYSLVHSPKELKIISKNIETICE